MVGWEREEIKNPTLFECLRFVRQKLSSGPRGCVCVMGGGILETVHDSPARPSGFRCLKGDKRLRTTGNSSDGSYKILRVRLYDFTYLQSIFANGFLFTVWEYSPACYRVCQTRIRLNAIWRSSETSSRRVCFLFFLIKSTNERKSNTRPIR